MEKLPAHGGNRYVHPRIAPDTASIPTGPVLNGNAPLFQYADGIWNHGEGFAPNSMGPDADTGGWFEHDKGLKIEAADVHTPFGWQAWNWTHPTHPLGAGGGTPMKRLYGYLKPQANPGRLNVHPIYGDLTTAAGAGPFGDRTYVDQAAFEIFRPDRLPNQSDKIVLVVGTFETQTFPRDKDNRVRVWRQVYLGFFSPDGLIRPEQLGLARTPDNFLNNSDYSSDGPVYRLDPLIVAMDPAPEEYYPIFAYIVPSVMHRQAELNEQRYLQLVQAVKAILMEDDPRNPMPSQIDPADIESQLHVIFAGSSNGGMQAMWAAINNPDIVHGNASDSMSASKQRLISELDMKHAVSRLSGEGVGGTEASEDDLLQWGQYAWNKDMWVHDLSMLQRYLSQDLHRPCLFSVGDEDITATGTDWVAVVNGAPWQQARAVIGQSNYGSTAFNRFAWMVGENGCHGEFAAPSAYNGNLLYHTWEALPDLITDVIGQHSALSGVTLPGYTSVARTSEFRGLDEPHEWALGRRGAAMTADAGLTRDDGWFNTSQPGAAGTMLGYKEAMLIRDGAVYVGSTEGMVSKFVVNPVTMALDKVAHTSVAQALGPPKALGHEAFSMTAMEEAGGWKLVVGTRRHLHKLDPGDLTESQTPTVIPWEVARPRRLKVGNVLPDTFHQGDELMFCSVHGGLVFYGTDLSPIWEWSEPGIVDFHIQSDGIAILSQRGVVARVEFVDVGGAVEARLLAASKPMPGPGEYTSVACQGYPVDLESMVLDWSAAGAGPNTALVAAWKNDIDEGGTRAYLSDGLILTPYNSGFGNILDIATTNQPSGYLGQDSTGDHLLVLANNRLTLVDQFRTTRGIKDLNFRQDPSNPGVLAPHAAGNHCLALAVGELFNGGGSSEYSDEVVVATRDGSLFWLHINELLGTTAVAGSHPLPSPAFDPVPGVSVQPRTNQNLSATWAVSRTGFDQKLHCLDRRGAYWTVDHNGLRSFQDNSNFVLGATGWGDLGIRDANNVARPVGHTNLVGSGALPVSTFPGSVLNGITGSVWAPKNSRPVFYEGSSRWVGDNWGPDSILGFLFHGFAVHRQPGTVLPLANNKIQTWFWSGRGSLANVEGDWGNLVQAFQIAPAPEPNLSRVDGVWSSVGYYDGTGTAPCELHDLRSPTTQHAVMNQQAVRAVELDTGQVAVVLGCPGGRVRVIQPGAMRTDGSTGPASFNLGSKDDSTDLGFGGSALAVRPEQGGALTIWFGTVCDPARRSALATSLDDAAVSTGAIHRLTWSQTSEFSTAVTTKVLYPSTPGVPRGGYGVVGIAIGNILGSAQSADEVVIGTVGGEIIILDENLTNVLWRANVPGATGFYNSIHIEDLDLDGQNELYVSGSFGIWRFTQ